MDENIKDVSKSKNGIYVATIIILLLIIFSMGMYIFADKSGFFEKVESSEQVNDSEVVDNKTEEDVVIKKLDLSKPLNTTGIMYSDPRDSNNNYGISMSINADKKSVTLSFDWNVFSEVFGPTHEEMTEYQIIGFNKEIKDVFVGNFSQAVGSEALLYLMNDGTVEYTTLFEKGNLNYAYDYSSEGIIGKHFVSKGAVPGVTNVVTFYNVTAASQTGWYTSIGATADGSFYDLGNIIFQK